MSSKSRHKKNAVKYSADRVIGNGSFGVVYQATSSLTGETVAIKKVLQDRRYKNRELQIMRIIQHPNIVEVKDCFYSKSRNRDVFLNLVMEYIPETVYQTIRNHSRARQTVPFIYSKVYAYQICRAIAYCHSVGICHRDIKPQNLLLDPKRHVVKLCDFGSAKILVTGEPNVAYICSRYYRAPELIFEASAYTCQIDVWSLGCVIAECFLGSPLFQGASAIDQLIEIIKVIGSPSLHDINAMNPQYKNKHHPRPEVKATPWETIFENVLYDGDTLSKEAIDLISKLLVFDPKERLTAFEALGLPYFDELREPNCMLLNGCPLPPLFNFTEDEKKRMKEYEINLFPKISEEVSGASTNSSKRSSQVSVSAESTKPVVKEVNKAQESEPLPEERGNE